MNKQQLNNGEFDNTPFFGDLMEEDDREPFTPDSFPEPVYSAEDVKLYNALMTRVQTLTSNLLHHHNKEPLLSAEQEAMITQMREATEALHTMGVREGKLASFVFGDRLAMVQLGLDSIAQWDISPRFMYRRPTVLFGLHNPGYAGGMASIATAFGHDVHMTCSVDDLLGTMEHIRNQNMGRGIDYRDAHPDYILMDTNLGEPFEETCAPALRVWQRVQKLHEAGYVRFLSVSGNDRTVDFARKLVKIPALDKLETDKVLGFLSYYRPKHSDDE